jgi:hypothetical protein
VIEQKQDGFDGKDKGDRGRNGSDSEEQGKKTMQFLSQPWLRRSRCPCVQYTSSLSLSNHCSFRSRDQATNYHLGTLKAKLAKLRSELFLEQSGGGGGAGAGEGFAVARNGDARVALIGFPSGKDPYRERGMLTLYTSYAANVHFFLRYLSRAV